MSAFRLADSVCSSPAACGLPSVRLDATTLQNLTSNAFLFLGFLSVVFVVVGGIRYAISNGESAKLKQAKETILYAIIGLVVSLLAFAIVVLASRAAGGGTLQ
jgi:hypothetical protein